MTEAVHEYISRLLSNVGDQDPWQILAATASRLRAMTSGQSPETLSRRPAPTRWSVAEILAHLADSEVVAGWRIRSVLASNATPIQPFDQDRWAETFRYAEVPVEESLDAFEACRRATLRLLTRVDRTLYRNYGVHAERGHESVEHLIRLYAGHDLNHLQQIERILS